MNNIEKFIKYYCNKFDKMIFLSKNNIKKYFGSVGLINVSNFIINNKDKYNINHCIADDGLYIWYNSKELATDKEVDLLLSEVFEKSDKLKINLPALSKYYWYDPVVAPVVKSSIEKSKNLYLYGPTGCGNKYC